MESAVNKLIPSLVENGVFGDCKFVTVKSDDQTEIGAQFASSLAFVNLVVEDSSNEKMLPLVLKIPTNDTNEREIRGINDMFFNEVTMYRDVLPALGYGENKLAKIHYGIAKTGLDPDEGIIIIENLKYRGYVPSKLKHFLDFEHISIAIKEIAKFHAASIQLKSSNREKFDKISKMLKVVSNFKKIEEEFDIVKSASLRKGVEAALKKHENNEELIRLLSLLEKCSGLIKLITEPEEPFAVICHGDFSNNNILFKYSEKDEPVECVLIDFQLSHYSSPVKDLMFFLYMNTTSDTREKYWEEFLKLYWETLKKNVTVNLPSYQEFLEHIEKRALYGYITCGWFLPIVINTDRKAGEDILRFLYLTLEKKVELLQNIGGEAGEKLRNEIILHCMKMNYIRKFLDFCDEKKYSVDV